MEIDHKFKTYWTSFQDSCDHDRYEDCMSGGTIVVSLEEQLPDVGEVVFLTEPDFYDRDPGVDGVITVLARVDDMATSWQGTHQVIWLTYLDEHRFEINKKAQDATQS